jgi:MtN3 and saliva related transmembrane protein
MNKFVHVLPIIGTILFVICYLPQIIKIFKTKSAKDLTPWFQTIEITGLLLYAVYSTIIGNLLLIVNYLVCACMASTIIVGWWKYGRRK